MANYIVYKCDTCLKTQTIKNSSVNVVTNHCSATDRCMGKISVIGESDYPIFNSITKSSSSNTTSTNKQYYLSSSESNGVALAIKCSPAFYNSNTSIKVVFKKQSPEKQIKRSYYFNLLNDTQILSGRDDKGNILQIDWTFLTENILVFVNGNKLPESEYRSIQSNNASLNFVSIISKNSNVEVVITNITSYITTELDFTANVTNSNLTAWSNIKYVNYFGSNYYVYSCDNIILDASSFYAIHQVLNEAGAVDTSIEDAIWLMADYPFSNIDRRLDMCVRNLDLLDYCIKTDNIGSILSVEDNKIYEVYPLLKIEKAAYLTNDNNTKITSSSQAFYNSYINNTILSNIP